MSLDDDRHEQLRGKGWAIVTPANGDTPEEQNTAPRADENNPVAEMRAQASRRGDADDDWTADPGELTELRDLEAKKAQRAKSKERRWKESWE